MKYQGIEISWNDEKEKFVSEMDGIKVEKTNLREVKKIIDDRDNPDKIALRKDKWFRTNSIDEVEILRKKGNSYVVKRKGSLGRGSTEYFLLKNNEKNKKIKSEIEALIKKQEELQEVIESKFDGMEQLK